MCAITKYQKLSSIQVREYRNEMTITEQASDFFYYKDTVHAQHEINQCSNTKDV